MPPPKSSMTAAAASSSLLPVVISFECSPLQLCDLPSLLEHRQQQNACALLQMRLLQFL
jgi:hypothetical protein